MYLFTKQVIASLFSLLALSIIKDSIDHFLGLPKPVCLKMPRFANPKSIASILVGWKLEARLEVILMMMLTEMQTVHSESVRAHQNT